MLKVLKLGVIGSLRSVESVEPNGNWKPKKFKKSPFPALPSQASTTLPPALALPPREASTSQATALPPSVASTSLATALPPGEASAPLASTLPPSTREGITPSQARSVESVKPNGNWKPKKFKMCKT